MPIAKMKRLQVLALERDHDALLRQLERMGCVEISEPDAPDAPESLRRCDSETADCLARQRQVQTAIDALRRAAPPKKVPLLAPRPTIGEAEYLSETGLADGLALARQVNEAAGRLQQLTALAAQLETDRITLGPWLSLDLPLELTETRCCDVTLGVLPPFVPWDELCGQVQNEYPESELHLLSADRQQQCVLLITHKAATAPVLELLRGRGFAASPLKGRTGTPEENRRRDTDRLAEVKRQQEALRKQLDELAERLPELYLCADRLASRLQREENRRRLLTDGCIVAFDGWVPEKKTARLTAYLDTADCDYTLSDPTVEQIPEVPVLLEDNAVARSMNCITEQYSLPAYDGVDPNPVMAPFFILFFGMMMADIGYGLLMLLGSWLFLKKKRPDDRSFMEMIFWCGVTTVVFGAMTGSFFGDFLPQLFKFFDPESTFALPALFSPLDDTMAIMVGSLILGALQVFTGMTVSVVEKCKKGCFMDALFDEITWWIILAGTGLAVLGIGSVSGVPVVLIAGVLMLVYGAGRGKKGFGKVTGFVAAVYNGVTGFFSDILSYVRLMALMLSGAVLAQVFNMLGATTGNVVTFIIIAFVGNMLNLALNLLGCYVHDMRLQFLEFFGRFYKDGGKAYRPLRVRAKHVEIIKEDTKSC